MLLAGAAVRAVSAIPVPMNHRLTADEAAYILDNSDAVLAFAGDTFLPVVEAVRTRVPRIRMITRRGTDSTRGAPQPENTTMPQRPELRQARPPVGDHSSMRPRRHRFGARR